MRDRSTLRLALIFYEKLDSWLTTAFHKYTGAGDQNGSDSLLS